MLKKSLLILFIIFCILCISNICFANDMASDMKDAVNSASSTLIDGTKNLAADVRNGVGNVENGIEGALTMDNMNTTNMQTTSNDYTATRTSSTTNATGMNTSTMWIWMIVAIAAIGIVGLVWFYASQHRVN